LGSKTIGRRSHAPFHSALRHRFFGDCDFGIGAIATEGTVGEVTYMWPRPGDTTPVQKVSFVTKVGDQVCGVGYYK
jgi:hypothetical protein